MRILFLSDASCVSPLNAMLAPCRLEEGYKLIIGGVDIPHTVGCVAHSDGDVLLHTVTDAILGALALPDIGQIFPDTDPKWYVARSLFPSISYPYVYPYTHIYIYILFLLPGRVSRRMCLCARR